MKNTTIIPGIALFILLLVNKVSAQSLQNNTDKDTYIPALNGAWERFYHNDGKTTTTGEPKEFVIVYDGFFSSIAQDSTGRWISTHAGTYEVSGNTMKNTLRYSSYPNRLGSIHWTEYELKGDTLVIKWFQKLINAQGQDITAQMPKSESRYVRAKK
jgi:hypothetical protein